MSEHPAVENLRSCQRQLDMDGCEVGVSRQALEETLAMFDELLGALKETVWRDNMEWAKTGGLGTHPGFHRANAAIEKAEGQP